MSVHGDSVSFCPDVVVVFLESVQTLSDLAGMAAASFALVVAVARWLCLELRFLRTRPTPEIRRQGIWSIRCFLGNYILLGLEFMIVSDIIHSFLKPELESLTALGVLVVIRTAISYFLGKELETAHAEPEPGDTPS